MVRIGISGSLINSSDEYFEGNRYSYVNEAYVQAVAGAGAVPIILPIVEDKEVVKAQLNMCDGLLLSGGYDIDPYFYGQEPRRGLGAILQERDRFDLQLFHLACEMNIPILGICRGFQMMNIALGGTLIQDLASVEKYYIQHDQEAKYNVATHTVIVEPDSELHRALGDTARVNTYHHQAVDMLAPSLRLTAHSKDGLIEGYEHIPGRDQFEPIPQMRVTGNFGKIESLPTIIGVQWHPEMLTDHDPGMVDLFKIFVEYCQADGE